VESTVPAYRLRARVQNNRLWRAVLDRWPDCQSQTEAAAHVGLTPQQFGDVLNLKRWPFNRYRERWNRVAQRIATVLARDEDYLFDARLYGKRAAPVDLELHRPALEAAGLLALPEASPLDRAEGVEVADRVRDVLATLTPREADVIRKRFGLDDEHEHTLAEVGAALDRSSERARLIEQKALRKLRHHSRRKRLRPFLYGEEESVARLPVTARVDEPEGEVARKTFARGVCPVCGREACVTDAGVMFRHYRYDEAFLFQGPCSGAGRVPRVP
jgi:sigma-70-like protein